MLHAPIACRPICPFEDCKSIDPGSLVKIGRGRNKEPIYRCTACNRSFSRLKNTVLGHCRLPRSKALFVLTCLSEGKSAPETARIAMVNIHTAYRLQKQCKAFAAACGRGWPPLDPCMIFPELLKQRKIPRSKLDLMIQQTLTPFSAPVEEWATRPPKWYGDDPFMSRLGFSQGVGNA